MGRHRATSIAVVCAAIALVASRETLALDPFEIQVYTPDTNQPFHFGLELHSNDAIRGLASSNPPELPNNAVLHETLEPSFGLPHGFELGAYLQTALQPSGEFDYAGSKLRLKWHIPTPQSFPLAFGVNLEFSWLPARYDAAVFGSEIRPIIEWRFRTLTVDLNPILTFDWTGPYTGVPHFEPAAAIRYAVANTLDMGIEYYGALGPLTAILPINQQAHYVFGTVNLIRWRRLEAQFGIGGGLTSGSNPLVVKSIVGYEF